MSKSFTKWKENLANKHALTNINFSIGHKLSDHNYFDEYLSVTMKIVFYIAIYISYEN